MLWFKVSVLAMMWYKGCPAHVRVLPKMWQRRHLQSKQLLLHA